jgi:glycerol uptake facilitator-like aquaporin
MAAEPASEAAEGQARGGADRDSLALTAIEALGSGLLAFVVVASGIIAERHAIHNTGLALLMTSLAGASAFTVLAAAFRGRSVAFFNPAFTLALLLRGEFSVASGLVLASAQIAAAFLGVMTAHIVTNTGLVQAASQIATGPGVWLGEFLATAIFILAMLAAVGRGGERPALTGGLALLAASLATPSVSFANPALTLARALTDSFTALRLEDAAIIALIQALAAIAAVLLDRWLRREA